jgi:membrane-bound lytic murein transglycosylase D
MIESGFNPFAYSRSNAAGLWQFIESTGKNYGLKKDFWIDERFDPEKATDAALAYLKYLYDMFGDWHLAMAAYNGGENGILRALNKSFYNDFWTLPPRSIKPETGNYVPKIIAAILICSNPQNYGFDSIPACTPLLTDTVTILECISLDTLAQCAGLPRDSLRFLNPSLRRGCLPPYQPFTLKIPAGSRETFLDQYANLSDRARIIWKRYQVQKDDHLNGIAQKFGTTPDLLRAVNTIKSSKVYSGMVLIVPDHGGTQDRALIPKISQLKDTGNERIFYKPPTGRNKIIYTIKPGDFLERIAKIHDVGVSDLRTWNNLGYRSQIYAGKKLVIYVKPTVEKRLLAATPTGNASIIMYTVQRGDNLWTIANMFNTSTRNLCDWNDLPDGSKIRVGQKLEIYSGKKPAGKKERKKVMYEIRRGDTITGIAKTFSVNVQEVLQWNNLTPKSLIRPGNLITLWIME